MKILVIKSSAIGDIIHAFPVIHYLRQKFPTAEIDWVVEKPTAELLLAHPHLNRILIIDTKKWRREFHRTSTWREIGQFRRTLTEVRYDLIFDLQGNTKSAVITALSRGGIKVGFGWKSVSEKLNLFFTKKKVEPESDLPVQTRYLNVVQSYFEDREPFFPKSVVLKLREDEERRLGEIATLPTPLYMVAFGSNWRNKRLPTPTLQAFLRRLEAFFLFTWGNEHEKKIATELHAAFPHTSLSIGNLSLPLWQAFMRKVDLVIAMDSAALHLCATTDTPSFSIFGPSMPAVYKPLGAHHSHIQGPCPYGRTFTQRCPILRTCPTGACIRDLTAQQIFEAFENASKCTQSSFSSQ